MTKFHFAILSFILFLVASCGKLDQKGPCTIDVYCDIPGFVGLALFDSNNQPIDTTLVFDDGHVSFSLTDSTDMPYIAMFRFFNGNIHETLELPVAIEKGHITATLGEQVMVTGTPLNSHLQSFLNSRAKLSTKIDNEIINDTILTFDEKMAKIDDEYSDFYLDAISDNKDNPIGVFIFNQYGHSLQGDDLKEAEQILKINL